MNWLKGCLIVLVALAALLGGLCYFVVWPYMHPRVEITVVNDSDVALLVDVDASPGYGTCGAFEVIQPHTTLEIDQVNDSPDCWGSSPEQVEFRTYFGRWTCDWDDAKDREPVGFTIDGPQCETYRVAVSPTVDPRTPGLPFSPPQTPVVTPGSPLPATSSTPHTD